MKPQKFKKVWDAEKNSCPGGKTICKLKYHNNETYIKGIGHINIIKN